MNRDPLFRHFYFTETFWCNEILNVKLSNNKNASVSASISKSHENETIVFSRINMMVKGIVFIKEILTFKAFFKEF